jgi:hypothetical protein
MTNQQIVAEFEQGHAPGGSFHHADHVRVAFAYVSEFAFTEAVTRFSDALKRFAAAAGKPQLYHETITLAYLALINERRAGREQGWEEFARENPDLLVWKGGVLGRYYRPETLNSELARHSFVLPDRCPQCSSVLEAEALRR